MTDIKNIVIIPLVFSSYTVLWLIIWIKLLFEGSNNCILLVWTLIVIISAITVPIVIFLVEKDSKVRLIDVKQKSDISHVFLIYHILYFIPFIPIPINTGVWTLENVIIISIVILIIIFIYVRTNTIYVNRVFLLKNYKVFKVKDTNGNDYVILTKENLFLTSKLQYMNLIIYHVGS